MNVPELFSLKGKFAVVTGASRGLGEEMARGLAEAGASLLLCSRKLEACEQVAAEIERLGVKTYARRCDVTSAAEVEGVVDEAKKISGRIDILINNAGQTWGAKAEELSLEDWRKVIEVNLTGAFLFAQQAGKAMIRQGGGKIVNVVSIAGLAGSREIDAVSYSASKGGLIALTRDLAVKWAKYRINVNAIAPGWFPTRMTSWVVEHKREELLGAIPMGRFGEPDDIKGALVFLCSEAARFVTGHVLVVDGGELAC
ncbi:MAG: gluconate 5-dehydrogenase [Deltaproteobacteria bacterium RIFCSPLOWO2_12_FULL_60_19]|nr:MAG: gluconate 5-dehydrogenase [Deltaproteobacteria bacterium RIFCSPLOWO2_12_FULL_60_19]